jgi:hypothetical protein
MKADRSPTRSICLSLLAPPARRLRQRGSNDAARDRPHVIASSRRVRYFGLMLRAGMIRFAMLVLLGAFVLTRAGPACASMLSPSAMLVEDAKVSAASSCHEAPHGAPAGDKERNDGERTACATGCVAAPAAAAIGSPPAATPGTVTLALVQGLDGLEG